MHKKWHPGWSSTDLEISGGQRTVFRPGNISSFPAAFCPMTGKVDTLHVKLDELPDSKNSLSFGVCGFLRGCADDSPSLKNSHNAGVGCSKESYGIILGNIRESTCTDVYANGLKIGELPKLLTGDLLTASINCRKEDNCGDCISGSSPPQSTLLISIKNTLTSNTFVISLPHGNYCFAMTLPNNCTARIVDDDNPIDLGVAAAAKRTGTASRPAITGGGHHFWHLGWSNKDLEISIDRLTALRPGSISSFPTLFTPVHSYCNDEVDPVDILRVSLDELPESINAVSFGVSLMSYDNSEPLLKNSQSDGIGKSFVSDRGAITHGIFCSMKSDNYSTDIYSRGMNVGKMRKLQPGDVLTASINHSMMSLEISIESVDKDTATTVIRLPDTGYIPCTQKPQGLYCYAMTLSDNCKVRILDNYAITTAASEKGSEPKHKSDAGDKLTES